MLRMDGSIDEGRAYGPFPVAPSHPVQSASARLRVWNRRRAFTGVERGIWFWDVVGEVALTWWTARAVGALANFGGKADIANARSDVCL